MDKARLELPQHASAAQHRGHFVVHTSIQPSFRGFARLIEAALYRHACCQPYEEVSDLEQLQSRMVQSLGDYNARSRKPMDLVMFMFAVEHVNRLAR